MEPKFLEDEEWCDFALKSWEYVGSPTNLHPNLAFANPYLYDQYVNRWLEVKYHNIFQELFEEMAPQSKFIQSQPSYFVDTWEKHFDHVTVWKQLITFFVFAKAMGEIRELHLSLAKAYIVGQAIPSMVVDSFIDINNSNRISPSAAGTPLLFSLTAYNLGLKMLHSVNVNQDLNLVFLDYTREMYNLMWNEKNTRFQLPKEVNRYLLEDYVKGKSRLLSSIFYAVNIQWVFTISNLEIPNYFNNAILAIRKVRQLNDEIADLDEDIHEGLITLPYLHSLNNKTISSQMKQNITGTWNAIQKQESTLELDLQRREMLQKAGSCNYASIHSWNLLNIFKKAIVEYFRPEDAFDIVNLIGRRTNHLIRMSKNKWSDNKKQVYEPYSGVDFDLIKIS